MSRFLRRLLFLVVLAALGAGGWTAHLYYKAPRERRSVSGAAEEAVDQAESVARTGARESARLANRAGKGVSELAKDAAGEASEIKDKTVAMAGDLREKAPEYSEKIAKSAAAVPGKLAKIPEEVKKLPEKLPDLPGISRAEPAPEPEPGTLADPICIARVARVVDGDTIEVETEGRREIVRLLMVNTPESVHPDAKQNIPMGKVASNYTRERLDGRQVRLAFDGKKETRDRYGRMLAYVFVEDRNFNVELVEQGLSPYYTAYGKSRQYNDDFVAAESAARQAARGIWGDPELAQKYLRLKSKWGQKGKSSSPSSSALPSPSSSSSSSDSAEETP